MVPIKTANVANPVARSRHEEIARHEAMKRGYLVAASHNGTANPAAYCDRLIAALQAAGENR